MAECLRHPSLVQGTVVQIMFKTYQSAIGQCPTDSTDSDIHVLDSRMLAKKNKQTNKEKTPSTHQHPVRTINKDGI